MPVSPFAPTQDHAARVLLLDDDPMSLLLTGRALRERGFDVTECDRSDAALQAIEQDGFDCVLCDVLMPGIDGFEFCRRVRASPRGATLPVLMLTSLDEDEATRRAYEAGASDYCIKSVNWTLLAQRIHQLLRIGRLERAAGGLPQAVAARADAAPPAAFEWQPAARRVRGTTGLYRLLDWPDAPVWAHPRRLLAQLAPGDRRALRRSMTGMLRGGPAVRQEVDARGRTGRQMRLRIDVQQVSTTVGGALQVSGAVRDVTPSGGRDATLYRLTHYDALTGLPNRTWLLERLASVRPDDAVVGLAVLDIDRFRHVGEALGQHASDRLLVEIARRLRQLAGGGADGLHRPAAAGRIDAVVHLAGDGFALLLDGLADEAAGLALARAAVDAIREPFRISQRELFVRASVGVQLGAADAPDPQQRLARAERARRAASAAGGDRALCFEPSMSAPGFERLEMERDLHYALARAEMSMHYQPQVDASNGRLVGFESLMRWNRDGRLESAARFIPLAEETGLIVPLGEWAIGESCEALAALRARGFDDCVLSVNLSCQQLRTGRLPTVIRDALTRHRLPPECLEVELTESGMMSDPEIAVAQLKAVREIGAGLAVDDFGTGYSSLAYLTRLPLTTLKIDRSFVSDVDASERSRAVALAIVALGANLHLRVVAEGVETDAQRDALIALGCNLQQGYLYGRAMPLAEALAYADARCGAARPDLLEYTP